MRHRAYSFRQTWRWCCMAALWLAAHSATVSAQPRVRVRAATRVELSYAQTAERVRVSGVLLDDLDEPLPSRALSLLIADGELEAPVRLELQTDARGRFQAQLPRLMAGRYRAQVVFEGDDWHAGSAHVEPLDLERHAVSLGFIEPARRRLNLDEASHEVVIQASTAASAAGLLVTLSDELDRKLGSGPTDASGQLSLEVPSSELGPAALGKLVARSAADESRAAAHSEIAVVRYRPTDLSLEARQTDGQLVLSGSLRDSRGGLPHKAVGLFDGDRHLSTTLTDRAGRFRARTPLPAAHEAPRPMRLSARFEADAPWVVGSRSPAVEIVPRSAATPSPLWLLLPMLASIAALWLGARRPRTSEQRSASVEPHLEPGIHAGASSRLRLPGKRHVEGAVVDADTGQVVEATVRLSRGGDRPHVVSSARDGSFRTPVLADGVWRIEIEAPGYAPLLGQLGIPHRGEWTRMQVRLRSLRSAAYDAYRPAALVALESAERAPYTTPSETLALARERALPTVVLGRLTHRLEQAAYGAAVPAQRELEAIAREAGEAVEEMRGDPGGTHPSMGSPKR